MLWVRIPRHEQSTVTQWPGAQAPGRPAMVGTPPRAGAEVIERITRGGAPSRARVAPPQGDAVEPAAPSPQGRRARRDRHSPVGRPGVAADQANAQTRKAWLCLVDES